MYDIIGDVHGHAVLLEKLLTHLGYVNLSGVFTHSENRRAIFVGDLVDRGPDARKVVRIVRTMVEHGTAMAVPGNHEFNLLSYLKYDGKHYLRSHTEKNKSQVEGTLTSYRNHENELESDLEWFQRLPIYIELNEFRVIHAAWIPKDIQYLKDNFPENKLSDKLLVQANKVGSSAFVAVAHLLKGVEYTFPGNFTYLDGNQDIRNVARIKWWMPSQHQLLKEMLVKPIHQSTIEKIPVPNISQGYAHHEKPVFFGHYCLTGRPALIRENVCCLDYCVYKNKKLTAYRWKGEHLLSDAHLIHI